MKTALIDRSLVRLDFREVTKKSDVYMYCASLLEAGADYVEIDLAALARLPKPNGSENYIFRIERPDEYIIANAFPFSYAVVPLRLSYLINKINIPVMLEVNVGEIDPVILVKVVSDSINLTSISLLRLLGDFKQLPDEFNDMVMKFRLRYAVPIDICPTNNSLMGLSTAVTAYASKVGSVTLSFGGCNNFASMEEFLITLSSIYRIIITKSYIAGICKAAMLSFMISSMELKNLNLIMKHYRLNAHKIVQIDAVPNENRIRNYTGYSSKKKKTATEKKLSKMKIDEEITEKITKVLKTCGIELFSDENYENDDESEKIKIADYHYLN